MKRFVAAAAILTAHCTGCLALDLKGVRLGMTLQELQDAFPISATKARPTEGHSWCYSQGTTCTVNVGTLGGVPTQLNVNFLDGKLAHAYSGNLYPQNFSQLAEALKSKFGPPNSSTVGEVQNRMGGKFENPNYVWKFPEGELRAAKFMPGARTLDAAQVEINSPEWIAKTAAEKAQRDSDL